MQATTKRWIRRALIGTTLAIVLGAGVSFYLLRRPPAVWTEAQQILAQKTPEQRAEQAEQVLNRLSAMLVEDADPHTTQGADPLDPQSTLANKLKLSDKPIDQTHKLRLSNEELVAVVSAMFSDWTVQRGYDVPGEVTEPVVLVADGQLAIAFEISTANWQQVFSGYVELEFQPDGMAIGRVDSLTAGSLPMSVTAVGEMLKNRLPDSEAHLADQIGEWIAQLEGFEFRPVLELENRRRARVVDMTIGEDAVTLHMRVQDHETYKQHNALLASKQAKVTDDLRGVLPTRDAIADVPTTTE